MGDCMMFPKDWHDFIKDYSFIDSEHVYTNGSELIQVLRVTQLIEHLLIEQEEQIKNRDESLEKAREEIKWLRGMLKEQEAELLTFDEVKKHYSVPNELHGDIKKTIDYENDIVPLYLECTYEDAWVVHWRDYHNISMHLDSWEKDYGKTWRCWTAKPTAEQRSAAKWN